MDPLIFAPDLTVFQRLLSWVSNWIFSYWTIVQSRHPNREQLDKTSQYLPFLEAFDVLVPPLSWLGNIPRLSPYFVQISGSFKSPLAIHIFNPTFFITDSLTTVTDDPTNPTIRLLCDCGLSSD
jgi:hypothetical protein